MTIQQKLQEFMSQKTNAEKEAGAKFLEENKNKPGVITLPNGLQYEIITKGTGAFPKATDTVKANYIGALIDGKEFDNSYKRGEPTYNSCIRCNSRMDGSAGINACWQQMEIIYSF